MIQLSRWWHGAHWPLASGSCSRMLVGGSGCPREHWWPQCSAGSWQVCASGPSRRWWTVSVSGAEPPGRSEPGRHRRACSRHRHEHEFHGDGSRRQRRGTAGGTCPVLSVELDGGFTTEFAARTSLARVVPVLDGVQRGHHRRTSILTRTCTFASTSLVTYRNCSRLAVTPAAQARPLSPPSDTSAAKESIVAPSTRGTRHGAQRQPFVRGQHVGV